MAEKQKETFEVTVDDKEVKLAVIRPKPEQGREAQKTYNRVFSDSVSSGALLRKRLMQHMREQGLWDDEKEAEELKVRRDLDDMEFKLQKGGFKLNEARDLSIDMRRKRFQLRQLLAERSELNSNTAEGQAENARFNRLVSLCLVYNDTGKPYYETLEDYLSHAGDDAAFNGAQLLAQLMYELDKDFEKGLPENQFLQQYKFVDNELRLVDSDGNFIDVDGRVIDEDGNYLDDDGNPVDEKGRRIDSEGNFVVEFSPFLDDDGQPVAIPGEEAEAEAEAEEEKPKKRGPGRPRKEDSQ